MITCKFCNKEFESNRPKNFCSNECRIKFFRNKEKSDRNSAAIEARQNAVLGTCQYCKNEFPTYFYNSSKQKVAH